MVLEKGIMETIVKYPVFAFVKRIKTLVTSFCEGKYEILSQNDVTKVFMRFTVVMLNVLFITNSQLHGSFRFNFSNIT